MFESNLATDNCLKCSLCNTACPVLGVEPQYAGPKRLGPELQRLREEGLQTDTKWLEYCLGCHRCDLACPHGVSVSEMIAAAKAVHPKPPVRRLRDWWFARPGLLGALMTILPALSNFALSLPPARWMMAKFMLISAQRTFPAYVRPRRGKLAAQGKAALRVVFFPGCYLRYNRPDLQEKIVRLLQRNGLTVQIADTGCCGVPAMANGEAGAARSAARANLAKLGAQVKPGTRIVTACSSCGHMLKTGFAGILEKDEEGSEAARRIAENSYDLGELLAMEADASRLDTAFKPLSLRLAYHAPCHQKSQGMGRPWFHLLRQIPGVTIQDLDAGCCGMSGTYGFKQEKYPISMAIGQELFAGIRAAQAQVVTTECATCQMQIAHGSGAETLHPAEILCRAYEL
jgi:glycerol-3-phosphate dehydrogenase subunit C